MREEKIQFVKYSLVIKIYVSTNNNSVTRKGRTFSGDLNSSDFLVAFKNVNQSFFLILSVKIWNTKFTGQPKKPWMKLKYGI